MGNSWGTVNAILGLKYEQNHPNGAVSSEQKPRCATKKFVLLHFLILTITKNLLPFSILLHQSDLLT